ncbi:MAG: ATP-dependent DNA ligase [Acidobacteriota bacterium]
MLLNDLVSTSLHVAATRSRLTKIDALASLLARLSDDEVEVGVGFLTGGMRQGKIGIGVKAARAALAEDAETEVASLTLMEVDQTFSEIQGLTGPGSGRARIEQLSSLFSRATAEERRFLSQLVVGELRQGALEGVMAEAVATAASLDGAAVRRAAMVAGDLRAIAVAALREGEAGLAAFEITVLRPLQPMLASPADDVASAMAELIDDDGDAAALVEWKLDGARVQVHRTGDVVRVYTRRLHDVTAAVPELVEATLALDVETAILDGETIALRDDGSPHPFQTTMRRFGRRLDVEAMRRELPLSIFFFDLLFLDGAAMIDRPLSERLDALAECVPERLRVPSRRLSDLAEAERFVADAIQRGHEGAMAKNLTAPYAAGSRGRAWLKLKPVHTLDLVVLAAEWGSGRRRGTLSNLHLGARDAERGGFVMLGKTFKGLTDALLTWQTRELLAREVERTRRAVVVRPELVVEIAFNDVQASTRYAGGLALRFARVKRYRTDKTADEADSFDAVRQIYSSATGLEPPPR